MEITFDVKAGEDGAIGALPDFAKSEVERCRRFQYGNKAVAHIGSMDDMRLYVAYDAAGNGTCRIEYTENVTENRIVSGVTRIGIINAVGAVIQDWETQLFRDCGRHPRVFSSSITRKDAEAVTGLQFRTVGNAQAQRC